MSSDLDRFLRAVRTLAKLAWKYDHETFVEALGRYASVQQEGDVWFVGTFLDDIGCELSARRAERCCRQCGKQIADNVRYNDRNPRADAQYCSPGCRQRAYRGRVTANTTERERKRNGNDIPLRPWQEKRRRAVTVSP